jgi:hypothetical protein
MGDAPGDVPIAVDGHEWGDPEWAGWDWGDWASYRDSDDWVSYRDSDGLVEGDCYRYQDLDG